MSNRDSGPPTRRQFLGQTLAAAAGMSMAPAFAALRWERRDPGLVPPDAQKPAGTPSFALQLGYASITWGGKDEQAIDEIAELGYRGIQLRSGVLTRWGDRPQELRDGLAKRGLALLCFSSGSLDAVPDRRQEYLDTHLAHARFVKAVGGSLLQVISQRPKDRAPTPEEFVRLGALLTELGQRTLELGVRLVYHNHMHAFGEAPEEVARVLDLTDPRFVSLLLDIAHYQQGGGDPVAGVRRHADRLVIMHLKDVVSPLPGDSRPSRESYRFVELGRGRVDVPGVVAALRAVAFRGPGVIELDAVPAPGLTPRDCAATNKRYALETLGLSL